MNRRHFLINLGLIGAGAVFVNSGIYNTMLYSKRELQMEDVLSMNLSSAEKMTMDTELIYGRKNESLTKLKDALTNNPNLLAQIAKKRDEMSGIVLKKSHDFSRKTPSRSVYRHFSEKIDSIAEELDNLKENRDLKVVNFRRGQFVLMDGELKSVESRLLKEIKDYEDSIYPLESLKSNGTDSQRIIRIYKTLERISPDASFISYASKESGIPLEEIIAFADVESVGREFAIGRNGEVNRFQLTPRYVKDMYSAALSRRNSLSEYLYEKTSEKRILEDAVRDSKVHIALAANFIGHLKEQTNNYYEYILAYNRGLGRAKDLPSKARKKLRNPHLLSKKDLRQSLYSYYNNFLSAKKSFTEVREAMSGTA